MEKMYINGNFVESKTHEYIDVENPATEEILGRFLTETNMMWKKLLRRRLGHKESGENARQ
ncbi:hypothetical protein [Thalassobacillus sp. C254]|uniref:hypothetical protein n=1 Tax=Thalassobacillus sp. C254 TaxID=1225341 RepID=UPI00277D162E|nr:hypothetical protein [Thalassobacillus sp. C254]